MMWVAGIVTGCALRFRTSPAGQPMGWYINTIAPHTDNLQLA